MKKMPTFVFWAPYCGPFWTNWGSANRPKIVQFLNFRPLFYSKSKFKGGPFYEKNCQLMYLRPHFAGRFDKRGVCQSANNGPFWKICNFFLHKIRIQRGSVLRKNLLTHVLTALLCGPIWTSGGVGQSAQTGPILTFENFKKKFKGGIFYEKNCHLV